MSERVPAILLMGPTGSGKTPLGGRLERYGFAGKRCVHFDFGENLRTVARARRRPAFLSSHEQERVRQVLAEGALLEDREFSLAEKILRSFLARRKVMGQDIVVLNGLPRHVRQARRMDRIVSIRLIVCLDGSARTMRQRIRFDRGGDRTGREDDSPAEIGRKLRLYRRRTLPVLDYYRKRNVPRLRVRVEARTTAETMSRNLRRRWNRKMKQERGTCT